MIPEIDEDAPAAGPPHYSLWTMRGRAIARLSRPDGKRGKPTGIYKDAINTFAVRAMKAAPPDHRVNRWSSGEWHSIGEALRWYDDPGYVAAFRAADRIARRCDAGAVLRSFALLVESMPVTEWSLCRSKWDAHQRTYKDRSKLGEGCEIRTGDDGKPFACWPGDEAARAAANLARIAARDEMEARAARTDEERPATDIAAIRWGVKGPVLA